MPYDRRYPYLEHMPEGLVDLPAPHDGRFRRLCKEVTARCGVTCWWNRRLNQLYVTPTDDPSRFGYPLRRCKIVLRGGRIEIPDADEVCREIGESRAPMWRKQAMIEEAERADRAALEKERVSANEAAMPDVLDHAKHIENKMTLGRHSRPTALVS